MKSPPKEGQYVYTCGLGTFSPKIEVRRRVVLESKPGRLVLGDSRMPESTMYVGFNRPDEYRTLFDSADEAIEDYIDFAIEMNREEIGDKEKEIAELRQQATRLQKYNKKSIPVVQYADDWMPCDL